MDYDADGDLDILSGSYTGEVYLFDRLDSGAFSQGRFLTTADGSPLVGGTSIVPEAVDMDGDGDLDLVIGTRTSGVNVVTNEGTRQAPVWSSEKTPLKTVNGERVMGSNAHHADWDGDGVRDLILGSERGEVAWYRNLGTNDEPRYGERAVLISKREYTEIEEGSLPLRPASRTKVHVTDYDGDGQVDLLVGDVQWHSWMLPPLTPEQEQEKADLTPEYEAAKKAYYDVVDERNSYVRKKAGIPQEVLDRMAKANDVFRPYRVKMASFDRRKSKTHGYVWLYLRRPEATAKVLRPVDSGEATSGPVSFRVSAAPIEGKPGQLRLTARLSFTKGWHVYADVPDGGQYPETSLAQRWPDGVECRTDWTARSRSVPDPNHPEVTWFVDEAIFQCDVVLAKREVAETTIEVRYQVCNDTMCLPPSTLAVTLPLARASTAAGR